MTQYDNVILDIQDHVATITLNKAEKLNVITPELLADLSAALDEVNENLEVRALVLTGAGEKAFAAGANIKAMKDMDAQEALVYSQQGNDTFLKLSNLRVPTIAAVNGYALGGGCEMALSCDIRYAAESAIFGQPEVGLGIPPGFGGTQRLSRLVGPGIAKELIFTGRNVKAEEALKIGLANRVLPLEELVAEAQKVAGKIAANAPIAVEKSKELIDAGLEMSLENAVAHEALGFAYCFATEDQKNGMEAFVNKEKAEFKHQ